MIPTSVTNSPPAAGLAQNGAVVVVNGAAAATVAVAATSQQQSNNNYSSIVLGLASLILEGRPIADDEYQQQQQQQQSQQQQAAQQMTPPTPPSSTVTGSSGRLSPRPSTSRAAINITTNPYAMASGTPRSNSQGYEYGQTQGHPAHGQVYGLGLGYGQGATTTSSSNSSSATHQRWTQKLCQLRQVSPAAQSMSVEPELVSLSINELNAERGDFEIVRRVMLNRAGVGGGMGGLGGGGSGLGGGASGELLTASNSSAGSSPGSTSGTDNILHSLQSLATTCLRGGPVMPAEIRPLSLSLGGFGSPSTAGTVSAASLLDYNCSRAGGGGLLTGVATGVAVAATTTTPTSTTSATASNDGAAASGTNNSNSSCASRPKHGPHCDQFLRKMGLAKGDAADAEEHFCDMSYINITCSRWRAHCLKMEAILARREPVCIEVYLGPAGHKILLEQWIISGKEKVPPPTMTLPSLCSAIRSQLYFSQIVAWCDLLRKGDPSVYESGRVIFANSSASNAGDLAGLSAAASSGGASTGVRRPRLNIFYRIRPHDVNAAGNNDGGFSGKANVHNFPHVNIAENFSVAVCVKSLPRINGGLPHIATPATVSKPRMPTPAASTPTGGGGLCAATPTGLGARIVISTTPPSSATGRGGEAGSSCDKRGERVEEEPAEDDLDGHRERQLLKYRKRMQRRDKKRERKPSDPLGEEPMDEGASEELMTTLTTTAMPAAAATAAPTQTAMVMTLAPPRRIAMISTGTQTSLSSCQQCGSEKTLMCLNCADEEVQEKGRGKAGGVDEDEDDTSASEMEDTSSCSLSSSDLIVGTPRNKAELLLQAIQRTPKNRKPTSGSSSNNNNNTPKAAGNDLKKQQQQKQQQQNNNQHKAMPTAPAPTTSGCQVCKRQKTQHNFNNGTGQAASNGNNDSNSMEQEEEEQQEQHTKLTPNVKSCSLLLEQERCQTPPDAVDEHIVVQFKTPLSHLPLQQQQQQQQQLPLGKASNQLRLNCSGMGQLLDRETPPTTTMSSMLSPLLRKALPKVNLTTIFCSSAPVAIDSEQLAFCFEPSTLAYTHTQSQSLLTPPEVGAAGSGGGALSVQKSYSAPTLPNALSVSPRFAKQAAFYKRRSRHLSDRSDRSSLGSDEQLSDEDFESGMYSPAGSPLKTRARLATQFGCRPLLGNLEESLLQKRLLPKIEVAGFRLQLGASGGFCPTQLTIPASSYFYELHGETLSTPYLCEIRLPRKGYFVPRSGTVQATLLNPMGTVVRMFVIPYDMRDMPPLHRTFIRQRILAEELPSNPSNPCGRQQPERERETTTTREPPSSPTATSTTSKLGHFISAEQMKRLRYSIHLRFQTSRSGRLSLHTDIRLLISRRTDCDTAAAHAKGLLEAPNELVTDTLMPAEPRYSARQESPSKI